MNKFSGYTFNANIFVNIKDGLKFNNIENVELNKYWVKLDTLILLYSEKHNNKIKFWWNNGVNNIRRVDSPGIEWKRGRI